MQAKVIKEEAGQRTFVVILDTEDEVMASLKGFVAREELHSGQFSAIGTCRSAPLGYFDWERKDYRHIPVFDQVVRGCMPGRLVTTIFLTRDLGREHIPERAA
jgi:hypothetical protein